MENEPFVPFEEDLHRLAERIRQDLPISASVYNNLLMHARGHISYFTFYVLRDHPLSHVVLWSDKERSELSLHCHETEVELAKAAMKRTTLLQWRPPLKFAHIPSYLVNALQEVAMNKTGSHLQYTECDAFAYDTQWDEPIRCKAGLRVCRLGRAGVRQLILLSEYDKHRPFAPIFALAQKVVSAGVYEDPSVESDSEIDIDSIPDAGEEELPLAWVSHVLYGGLGMLHTKEEHRGKGLGNLVTQVAGRMQKAGGYVPHAYVVVGNGISYRMFSRMKGWRQTHKVCWVYTPDSLKKGMITREEAIEV